MPRIPIGNFGNAIAEGAPRVNVPAGAFDQGEGLVQLARTGQAIASNEIENQRSEANRAKLQAQAEAKAEQRRIEAEQRAEDNRNRSQLESAQRMSAYLSFNSDVSMQTAEISDQLQAGKLKRDEVFPLFDKKIAELQQKHLNGLDPVAQETVKAHMITGQRTAALHLREAVKSSMKSETLALIERSKEDLQRLGVAEPEKAISQFKIMMDAFGPGVMAADQVEKAKNAFAERVYSTHYTERLTATERNPAAFAERRGPMSFETVIPGVLKREGGFVASDGASGAPANFGINQAANPDIDVRKLTKEKATELYRKRYWEPINADKLPAGTAIVAFDAAVNQGVPYAQKLLKDTGGDIQKMIEIRERDYRALAKDPKQAPNLAGWLNRLVDVRREVGTAASSTGLDALAQDVMGNARLDPDRKNVIVGKINGIKERLSAAAERADKAKTDAIERQIKEVDGMILRGEPPNARQLLAVQDAAKGTYLEDTAKQQAQFASAMQGFLEMNPRGQEQALNEMAASVAANPTPDGIKTRDAMRTIFKTQTEAVKNDPQSFAAQKGLYVVEPINLLQPTTLNDQLAKRVTTARAMRDQYGSPMQVFTAQEIDFVKQSFTGMLPDKKQVVLQQLAKGIGDPQALRDTAAQVDKSDKGLATALFLAGKGYFTEKGRNLAELYLAGDDALDTKKVKGDPFVLADIQEKLAGVYATADGRDKAVDVAYKVWAAGQSGKLQGLTSVSNAIEVATGGLMEHNGGKLAKPYGMKDGEFTDKIKALKPEQLIAMAGGVDTFRMNQAQVKASELVRMLPGARLQTVGDGAYSIVAGPDYVRLPNNRPLVIQVR
jgi:hypothetical protein